MLHARSKMRYMLLPFQKYPLFSDHTQLPLSYSLPLGQVDRLHMQGFSTRSVHYVGSMVLTAVIMKISIFWDITPYSPLKVNWRFGGKCHLHLQGWRINHERNKFPACFHAGFLLGLFFNPEDGGDMFLWNVNWLSVDCMALYPRR
jgi:hypothetical protein